MGARAQGKPKGLSSSTNTCRGNAGKIMTRNLLLLLLTITIHQSLTAQSKWLLETYYYKGKDISAVVPMLHVETKDNWYAEFRYNYEDKKTFSLYAGKIFTGGKALEYTITPLLGYSVGRFNGLSFATNAEAEWKDFFISTQTQYSLSVKTKEESFFFTWSEAGYEISPHFFTGLAIQYTRLSGQNDFEPGLLAGLSFKNISFPCYVFGPFHRDRYFVLGLNYELNLTKKKTGAL
jgi:hypothetical protein